MLFLDQSEAQQTLFDNRLFNNGRNWHLLAFADGMWHLYLWKTFIPRFYFCIFVIEKQFKLGFLKVVYFEEFVQ